MDYLCNTIITGAGSKFLLREIIGAGSFATVFKGLDLSSHQQVAVKTFARRNMTMSQLASIRYEASIMKRLSPHPNIMGLIASVETNDNLFIVMELCELDLFEAITRNGGFPALIVKEIFVQVIDALHFCHTQGIFHRDIKPENILITKGYRILLTDFGLCTTSMYSNDYGCGSKRYMSPDCLNFEKNERAYSTAANDVWALGILLLFGKNPWHEAHSTDKTFAKFLKEDGLILSRQFHLTTECSRIFAGIFTADANQCVSLDKLKLQILDIKKFSHSSMEGSMKSTRKLKHITPSIVPDEQDSNQELLERSMPDSFAHVSYPLTQKLVTKGSRKLCITTILLGERIEKDAARSAVPDSAFVGDNMDDVPALKQKVNRAVSSVLKIFG